jgi:signal peptidase
LGCASGVLPLVGRLTIIMNDYPFAKFATIGLLGFLVVTSNE